MANIGYNSPSALAKRYRRLFASMGGYARAGALTPQVRSQIAKYAAEIRWEREKGIRKNSGEKRVMKVLTPEEIAQKEEQEQKKQQQNRVLQEEARRRLLDDNY